MFMSKSIVPFLLKVSFIKRLVGKYNLCTLEFVDYLVAPTNFIPHQLRSKCAEGLNLASINNPPKRPIPFISFFLTFEFVF